MTKYLNTRPGIRERQALWRVGNSFMRTGCWIWFEWFLPGSHIIAAVDSHLCYQYPLQTFLSEPTAFLEYYTEVENMLPLGLGFWTIWCDHSSKQCQIISSSLLFCRRHMRVIPQWSLGGGSSSMNCPSWAIRDNEIHRSSLLGLTLLERVNQQSDTNKLQEGKLVAPKKVCNPGKIGEDQGIRSCLFWWWV